MTKRKWISPPDDNKAAVVHAHKINKSIEPKGETNSKQKNYTTYQLVY